MLTINQVRIDDPSRVYVVAEASGNHAQDYGKAAALVTAAAWAGADAVKFQTFTPEEICADIPLAFGHDAQHDAWLRSLGVTKMRELFSHGGLPRAWHAPLKALADSLHITFLSTPFSVDAAHFLVEEIGVLALKIASGDLTFTPLLEYAASTGLPVLLSTGASTYGEISAAVYTLNSAAGRAFGGYSPIPMALLHCMALYPCPHIHANLRVIRELRRRFHSFFAVGWSDHTTCADFIPALAVACGATIIEKHLKLEGDTTSVDAGHSLTPAQFKDMVGLLRAVPTMLGNTAKEPVGRERHERVWCRRDPSDWLRPTMRGRLGEWE